MIEVRSCTKLLTRGSRNKCANCKSISRINLLMLDVFYWSNVIVSSKHVIVDERK